MKTKGTFDVVSAVKDASRTHIGTLPLPKVIGNKKKKLAAKKPTKAELMAESR